MRYPGNSSAEVTIAVFTDGMAIFPPYATFTAAILTEQIIEPKQSYFATLEARGRSLLFPGHLADRRGRVSHLAGLAMARLCSAADAHRSRIPCAACRGALSVPGPRTGIRAKSGFADGIQSSKL